jgi:hypothetical protein
VTSRRLGILVAALLVVVAMPAGDLPWFAGLPLRDTLGFTAALLSVPLLVSRWVRQEAVRHLTSIGSNWQRVRGVVLAVAMLSKVVLLIGGSHAGWRACYHPVDARQLASGCERSYDNPFFLEHSTRLDAAIAFGAAGDRAAAPAALSLSNWNLAFFNSLRWNVLTPAQYREHLPFSAMWTANGRASGGVRVTYVGEVTIRAGARTFVLPPAYRAPASADLPAWRGPRLVTVGFRFAPPASVRYSGPYAMLHIANLGAAAPSAAGAVLRWLVDLPLLALLLALLVLYARIALRDQWCLICVTCLISLLPALSVVSSPETPTVLGTLAGLAAVAWRPSRRMLLFASLSIVLINAVSTGSVSDWHTVTYRTAGNDFLTYESEAQTILDSGSLQGGEAAFYQVPAMRYATFALRALAAGDGDALYFVVINSLLAIGMLVGVAVAVRAMSTHWAARAVAFALAAVILLAVNRDTVLGSMVHAGLSEWTEWACLPVGAVLVVLPARRSWLLAGALALAICVTSRPEIAPAAALLLMIGLVRWWGEDRRGTVLSLAVFAAVAALPLVHNVYFGHKFALFTTGASIDASEPLHLADIPRLFSNAHLRGVLEVSLRAVLNVSPVTYARAPLATSATTVAGIRLLQLAWVSGVIVLAVRRRAASAASKAMIAVPCVAMVPFVLYNVTNYYPRHIIGGYILTATTLMLILALEAGRPGWGLPTRRLRLRSATRASAAW